MDRYGEWNDALLAYFTKGIQRGSVVYLAIDDDLLLRVSAANKLAGSQTSAESRRSFCMAVRTKLIDSVGIVHIGRVSGRDSSDRPKQLAFLCAMVLAAADMANEENYDSNNYFGRLRTVLSLNQTCGRPSGLEPGTEEPLWQDWNRWLVEHGFLPSARPGKDQGYAKYISYPISQTLLRQADKVKLQWLFGERDWSDDWDPETLEAKVRTEAGSLTQHLHDLLSGEQHRFLAVTEAIHDVYLGWQEDKELAHGHVRASRILHSGLYREEDRFAGTIDYYLYPRQPRGQDVLDAKVRFGEGFEILEEERPGWYRPIGPLPVEALTNGLRLPASSTSGIEVLVLPSKHFWLLVPDPENPDSGLYASWRAPALGTPFILLCRIELLPQLERLRDERLIDWGGAPFAIAGDGLWLEIYDCMVLSGEWSGVFIQNRDLFEALRPKGRLDIGLRGGLRVPGLGAWIDGHGPTITVFGFPPRADLKVADSYDSIIATFSVRLNQPFAFEWPGAGVYRVEAACETGDVAQRVVRIVSWSELNAATSIHRETIELRRATICGAAIEMII